MKVIFTDTTLLPKELLSLADHIEKTIVSSDLDLYVPAHLRKFTLVNVGIIDQKQSRDLNYQYREKDKPTDVLSFEMQEGKLLGELFICIDEVKANAEYYKNDLFDEFTDVVVHGCLHLLQFDHSDKMFRIQDKLKQQVLRGYKNFDRTRKPGKTIRSYTS